MNNALSDTFGHDSRAEPSSRLHLCDLRHALRQILPASWSEATARISLAGELRHAGALADIVGLLSQGGRTGSLLIASEHGVRVLVTEGGCLAGAGTTILSERIGELLHRARAIGRDEIDEASIVAAIDGRRIGEVLVHEGRLDVAVFDALLHRQAEEIFYAAIRVDFGVFAFIEDTVRAVRLPTLGPSLLSLLMESARQSDEWAAHRETVPSNDHVPRRVTPEPAEPVDADLEAVFSLCDGTRSVDEIARHAHLFELEAIEVLCRLVKMKRLVIDGPPDAPPISTLRLTKRPRHRRV